MEEFYLNSNIRHLRVNNKETQNQLGKVIDKGGTTINNYEKGIRNPDCVDLYYLAKHFDISVEDLLTKDLRFEKTIKLDEDHVLNNVILEKTKCLSEDDKKKIIDIIDIYKK